MPAVVEIASTGRAKCRGCGQSIDKDTLRFGERVPNPFGDGEATFWFHLDCGARRRPEVFLELDAPAVSAEPATPPLAPRPQVPDHDRLRAWAKVGVEHHRLPRIAGLERAASGRAKCRHCKEPIAKDLWRVRLEIWEEGRFNPIGFVHVACAPKYFGTVDLTERFAAVSAELSETEKTDLAAALAQAPPP